MGPTCASGIHTTGILHEVCLDGTRHPAAAGYRAANESEATFMAIMRDQPYLQFNFLVDLGDGNTEGPSAGFQECSPIGMEISIVEYRNGNERENNVRKLAGLAKATDVTLKRGLIGVLNLYAWINDIRNGDQNAVRTVTIQLQNEDHSAVVQTWKLSRARIVKYTSGPFNAQGTDVVIEEIVLAYERLEVE
jgi:phage tail-like protein